MATVVVPFDIKQFVPCGTAFPQYVRTAGSTTEPSVEGLAFDGAIDELCCVRFTADSYGSGNLTLRLRWYAASTTSGTVRWGGAIACITPDTDTQAVATKTFATETNTDDAHLGTTATRVHTCDVTISNLDSITAGDEVWLRVARRGAHANDTLNSIDAILISASISYSD
jgi:hypothetical protein